MYNIDNSTKIAFLKTTIFTVFVISDTCLNDSTTMPFYVSDICGSSRI